MASSPTEKTGDPVLDDQAPSDTELAGPKINEKALLRKIDAHLLPAVGILYLLSFLDRSNVGNARIEGLLDDTGITADGYLNGLTLYFVGYVLFEIPCNIILKKTTPRIWLPTLTIVWGIVSTLLGIVENYSGFLAARFFLGVAESGLFPGVVYYFSMWYKRRERQYRVSLFFSAASLAGAFGGILAYTSSFLNEDERQYIQQRLSSDSDATHEEHFSWAAVREALKDPNCWLYGLGFHTMSLPLYTLSLFLPTIIKSLGYTAATAQLLTVPPYAFAFITTITVAILSEKLGQRALFIGGSSLFGAIGYCILLGNTNPSARPGVSYLGVFFAAGGIYPAVALVLSWPAINVSGQTKRAIANAMQISIGNCGAVIGTQLYRSTDGPRYVVGHSVALAYLVANAAVVAVLYFRLKKENKRREAIAPEVRDVGVIADWKGDSDPRWRFEY
ncbi:hypothetical protein KJ359_006624 [Pestalotiopsis sp. 9143b]|nr:hypothetical protein KJ359_006624 [Pestalotiopsis sp. 9143b]